jgi:hypothetical protein
LTLDPVLLRLGAIAWHTLAFCISMVWIQYAAAGGGSRIGLNLGSKLSDPPIGLK